MQPLDTITKDISTTCSANNTTDASMTNSEWSYINDLTDEECILHSAIASLACSDEDEARYILEKIKRLR